MMTTRRVLSAIALSSALVVAPAYAGCDYPVFPKDQGYMLVAWNYLGDPPGWVTSNQPEPLESCQQDLKNFHYSARSWAAMDRDPVPHQPFCMPYLLPSE